MPNHTTRKLLVAITTAFGLLAVLASPANADPGTIQDGTLTAEHNTEPPVVVDLDGSGTDPCASTDPLPDSDIDADITSGSGGAVVNTFESSGRFEQGGNDYEIDMALDPRFPQDGDVSGSAISDLEVTIAADIVRINTSNNCAPVNNEVCTATVQVVLDGSFTGTGTGDTVTLSGDSDDGSVLQGVFLGGDCDTTLGGFNEQRVSIDGLVFEFD